MKRAAGRERVRRPRCRRFVCAVVAGLVWGTAAVSCDYPFEPFQENEHGPFSLFGYLDLKADTQWVRVMPIRQSLLAGPEPIDALVTLERLGSGRRVTLHDSLFRFTDQTLESVAYGHNFWTTERLEPEVTYRLTAQRSDGATTTAEVTMPRDFTFTFKNTGLDYALLAVRAERVLLVEVSRAVSSPQGEPLPAVVLPQAPAIGGDEPGVHNLLADGSELIFPDAIDMRRQEIRIGVAGADWPYHPDLTDLEVTLPGTMPSNVENGLGFVGAVAVWTIPFHRCRNLAPPEQVGQDCSMEFSGESASISGRVMREPCGDPHTFGEVRLREAFDDGREMLRTWKTGWHGEYRFEGITPGAELFLDLGPGTPELPLPRLSAGERAAVDDLFVPDQC